MLSYKTIYLICIILCLMGYTDSGKTSEDQKLCEKNLRDDYGYPEGSLTNDIMVLPKKAFKNKVLGQFQTIHGLHYFHKMIEKATKTLTDSPKNYCYKSDPLSTLCMEQLHEVFEIEDENDALPVIKWTYIHLTESDVPKTFIDTRGKKVVKSRHFASAYFQHMLLHLDLYNSFPWPISFCQNENPNRRDRNQNYKQISDVNPEGESSRGEVSIREIRRARHARHRKKQKTDLEDNIIKVPFDD